jgi:hypothetical protein
VSHRHFCDFAGHEWECAGYAPRPLAGDTEPSECICLRRQVPMESGDHNECPIELLACPEHRDEQLQKMRMFVGNDLPCSERPVDRDMLKDSDGKPIVGFCLWCDTNFYSMEEMDAHNANDSAACAVFQELKERY